MLSYFGAIQDQQPLLAAQPGQQAVHAETRRHVGKMIEPFRVGKELAQTEIGVLAAVKAPQEEAVR